MTYTQYTSLVTLYSYNLLIVQTGSIIGMVIMSVHLSLLLHPIPPPSQSPSYDCANYDCCLKLNSVLS